MSRAKANSEDLFRHSSYRDYFPWVIMAGILVWMSAQLWLQGRVWWCQWDSPVFLWSGEIWSKHNSQHFLDPYSFTHLLHGFLFLWAAQLLFSGRVRFVWLLLLAVAGESVWEVIENSPSIIERYRENTASLEYFGDSIANSIGDVAACIAGFLVAYKLKLRWSLVLFFLIEAVLILTIRDSLLINILMLVYPIEAIKTWQTGGASLVSVVTFIFTRK